MIDTIVWEFDTVILGEVASSKNQRRIVSIKSKGKVVPRLIKSAKALAYSDSFKLQCPQMETPLEGDLMIKLDVWYASRRPDLSASDLIKDLLQGYAYANDRQIKGELSLWNLDRENPRLRIRLGRLPKGHEEGYSELG